jgi:predicted phosphodiesterase
VFATEATAAPVISSTPNINGSVVVISDPHIPFHDPHALQYVCEIADMLRVKRLVVAGDLLHFDEISRYDRAGKTVNFIQELVSGGRVLEALAEVFRDGIDIIPGNHDQRLEKLLAKMNESKEGRKGIEVIAALMGRPDPDHAEDITYSLMAHFLGKAGVTIHTLPDLTVNETWLIQHPGSVSRIAPQNERAMAIKHRKCVIQGHSHLWGLGFDPSGTDIAFNCGHLASEEKWRYMRERPTTFPRAIKGFGVILRTAAAPEGRLLPIALHERMFDLREVADILRSAS